MWKNEGIIGWEWGEVGERLHPHIPSLSLHSPINIRPSPPTNIPKFPLFQSLKFK